MAVYDPFAPGPSTPERRTFELRDERRGRRFPCDVWFPRQRTAGSTAAPLVIYSHHAGGHRRVATFLCAHLTSHGYVVAAMDHSEVVAEELRGRPGETPAERTARVDAIIAGRVPDVRLLLDRLLGTPGGEDALPALRLDGERVGLVGHSFGGWTVLATPDQEPRVRAVVAHAPGGGRVRRPAILPLDLAFGWGHDIPTLFLAGDADVPVRLDDVVDVFERTPSPKRLVVLHRADHQHFVDDVATVHEAVRAADFGDEGAWIPASMEPITDLCGEEEAHVFVRGLTLAHLDATLRGSVAAHRLFDADVTGALAARGVDAFEYAGRRGG